MEIFNHIESKIVTEAYEKLSNYLVKNLNNDGAKFCVVYCSSNGLYFPNTEENFSNTIYAENHFEWNNNRYNLSCSYMNIYLRDVFKQWYVKGINKDINSLDKIIDLISRLAKGKKIITIGSSSGGYLASIIGCKLSAEYILNFSGQFDLNIALINEDSLAVKYEKIDNTYFNIVDLIKKSKCDVFYFSSVDSKEDIKQRKLIGDLPNVHVFLFPGDVHGVPLKNFILKKIINLNKKDLLSLHGKYKNILISNFHFELDFLGIKGIMFMYLEALYRKLIKYIRRIRKNVV